MMMTRVLVGTSSTRVVLAIASAAGSPCHYGYRYYILVRVLPPHAAGIDTACYYGYRYYI